VGALPRGAVAACALAVATAAGLRAQAPVLTLWPEGVPNAQRAGGPERIDDGRVSNVHVPTLTYVAPSAKPTGMAVIVCPGGGYARLAMSNEPAGITERLSREGVAAFVLKYRLKEYGFRRRSRTSFVPCGSCDRAPASSAFVQIASVSSARRPAATWPPWRRRCSTLPRGAPAPRSMRSARGPISSRFCIR